ncbi:hypothetical protein BV22DRAFT_899049 [Leucogyrophana mollusca]|uniref:Uncharacterized protein n=1 Tax=Leucogyrophana mollusca TaxID=85980 RepID=A0ACB8AZ83_9AGAM|nr:hypothetical protein BV22DRAFT_899049 [Leucogyrophana mollusca]
MSAAAALTARLFRFAACHWRGLPHKEAAVHVLGPPVRLRFRVGCPTPASLPNDSWHQLLVKKRRDYGSCAPSVTWFCSVADHFWRVVFTSEEYENGGRENARRQRQIHPEVISAESLQRRREVAETAENDSHDVEGQQTRCNGKPSGTGRCGSTLRYSLFYPQTVISSIPAALQTRSLHKSHHWRRIPVRCPVALCFVTMLPTRFSTLDKVIVPVHTSSQ